MKIDKQSLTYRLLIPIFLAVSLITVTLVLFVHHVTSRIIDDYHHFVASTLAEDTGHLLNSSLAELTTAQLLDEPIVVEAKQRSLIEAIDLRWRQQGIGGIIVGREGKPLLTTFSPDLTGRILTVAKSGFFDLDDEGGEQLGQVTEFHPWGWRVITVGTGGAEQFSTRKVLLLLPIMLVGFLLLAAVLVVILRRTLHQPLAVLVAAAGRGERVAETGLTEFDRFGEAYNHGLERIHDHTATLAMELAERERAEAEVRVKEKRIRQLLYSTAEGIYGVDTDGNCTFSNRACCRMLGYGGEEDLLGRRIHPLIHHTFADGRTYPEEECRVYHAFRSGEGEHVDDEVFWRADGTHFPVEYWSHPVFDDEGREIGAVVAFFDITERREAERALRKASQEWRATFDSTADMIALLSPDGTVRLANQAFARFCGQEAGELKGRKCFEIVHHGIDHIDDCPLAKVRDSLTRKEMELCVDDKTFLVVVDPVFDEAGQFIGAVHTMHDFTERKQAEKALLAEKNKIEAFIAAMGDGVSIQDRDFTVLYQNEVHQDFFGAHLGERCYEVYESREEVCEECPIDMAFRDGKVHTVQRPFTRAEETRHFEITASPLRDASGAIIGGVEVARDITDRLRVEEQLRQAQKMEGIGHLAGGVAHDFNNVLSVVQGYCELLKNTLAEDDERGKDFVNQIDNAARRGATITRQILAFSRKQAITIKPVNVNELINGMEKMLRRLLREDIAFKVHLPGETLVVSADAGQLDQVLVNLVTNACHAMPEGGSLRVDLERTRLDGEFMRAYGDRRPAGDYALLIVTDTGIGMDESVRARIFEPFFTTKETGKGTGLGLAMVYGIVQKHNGFINVYSEPGHGSVFKIYLPLDRQWAGIKEKAASEEELPRRLGTETVLVAEDDPQVRQLSRTILEGDGYTVIEAADGEEAVLLFAEHRQRVGLVLLDGIMPRKNGKEALIAMRQLCPDLKAIILSGYAEDVFSQSDIAELKVDFVQKPVSSELILRKVRETLDQ